MKRVIGSTLFHWVDWLIGIPSSILLLPATWQAQKTRTDVQNILLVKIGTMGDVILMLPTLKALKAAFPDARITALCSQANAELFLRYPFVDTVYAINFTDMMKPSFLWQLIQKLRRSRFDLAIDFEEWSRVSGILMLLSGAKMRVGFRTRWQHKHYLFTHSVAHSRIEHELEAFGNLLKPLGIKVNDFDISLPSKERDRKEAFRIIESLKIKLPFAVLHCEVPASGRQRQWPLENLAEAGDYLVKTHKLNLVIVCTQKGRLEAEKLNGLLSVKATLVCAAPLFTLYEFLKSAKLVITNNSGFMHLAASADTCVVGLHGPTSAQKWGPRAKHALIIQSSLSCSPCLYLGFEYGCNTNKCMQAIRPEEVIEKIKEFLTTPGHKGEKPC